MTGSTTTDVTISERSLTEAAKHLAIMWHKGSDQGYEPDKLRTLY